MNKRLDMMTPRPGKDGKTFWHRVGTAWEGDKGITLVFDSLPLPTLGDRGGLECRVLLMEPRDKQDAPARGAPSRGSAGQTTRDEYDAADDVPFICAAMHEPRSRRAM